MSGALAPAEQLPSIRALANSLRVSAITTKRAYADLEAQGFIETVQGKGSFVAGGNAELIREERLRDIEANLQRAIEGAYADLEAQGFIETVQGKGSFVAGGNAELIREERLRDIEANLQRAIEGARTLSLADDEVVEMLRILLESDD